MYGIASYAVTPTQNELERGNNALTPVVENPLSVAQYISVSCALIPDIFTVNSTLALVVNTLLRKFWLSRKVPSSPDMDIEKLLAGNWRYPRILLVLKS